MNPRIRQSRPGNRHRMLVQCSQCPLQFPLHRPPLNGYAALLRGEMDCSLFASPADKSLSRFRYINGAYFFAEGDALCFEISANAFLWKMARCIVGSLLFYEERGLPLGVFEGYLNAGDHRLAGPTAPPHGLTLWKVTF